ncbi:MAG: lipocalin family protein [Bacteroidales bacterium]|nr:lipocalin family protein [Bacteroidales bacterium]MBN2756983.1 lipocalin family protein [Bacteroidales bacterium]
MKKTSYLFISLLIIAFISSCTKSPSDMIVGEWKISEIKTSEEIPDEQKEVYKQIMEDMKSSTKIEFKSDGTYQQTISEETTTGKWSFTENENTLVMINENGKTEPAKIIELTENKLVLENQLDQTKNTISWEKVK